jgi:hypothetical protein
VPLKTRKGIRSIPLPSVTVDALQRPSRTQLFERSAIGVQNWHADGLVFNAEDDDPLHQTRSSSSSTSSAKSPACPTSGRTTCAHYGSLLNEPCRATRDDQRADGPRVDRGHGRTCLTPLIYHRAIPRLKIATRGANLNSKHYQRVE